MSDYLPTQRNLSRFYYPTIKGFLIALLLALSITIADSSRWNPWCDAGKRLSSAWGCYAVSGEWKTRWCSSGPEWDAGNLFLAEINVFGSTGLVVRNFPDKPLDGELWMGVGAMKTLFQSSAAKSDDGWKPSSSWCLICLSRWTFLLALCEIQW